MDEDKGSLVLLLGALVTLIWLAWDAYTARQNLREPIGILLYFILPLATFSYYYVVAAPFRRKLNYKMKKWATFAFVVSLILSSLLFSVNKNPDLTMLDIVFLVLVMTFLLTGVIAFSMFYIHALIYVVASRVNPVRRYRGKPDVKPSDVLK